ncbi:phage tail protein [Teredinibacter purpureus]|uniref:phage tail protein n=1 Tax=Teredinibacter purpureus TaxID=2731756 RepID=UPI0005F7678A|nr:phage tail protein [Teredinibacter purpureus]
MPLQSFPPFVPRRGVNPSIEFRTRRVQFGDGYSQRTQDGLNARRTVWPLTFALPHADIASVVAFLDEHAGVEPFLWGPPNVAATPYLCKGYSGPKKIGPTHSELTCTFERVFDL